MARFEDTTVGIPFVGGIDTSVDQFSLPPTKLQVCQNGVFTKAGKLRKRCGYTAVGQQAVPGTTVLGATETALVGEPVGIATRDDELLLATTDRLYSYDDKTNKWAQGGRYYPCTYETGEESFTNTGQSNGCVASAGGITACIWEDTRGTVRYTVRNTETGAIYVYDTSVEANSSKPAAVPVGNNVVLLWYNSTTTSVKGIVIQGNDVHASLAGSYTTFLSDLDSSGRYAVHTNGTDLLFGYYADSSIISAGVAFARVTPYGVVAWRVNGVAGTPTAIDVTYESTSGLMGAAYYTDAAALHFANYAISDGTVSNYATSVLGACIRIAVGPSNDDYTTGNFFVAYEIGNATTAQDNQVYLSPSDFSSGFLINHAYIASTGFRMASGLGAILLGCHTATGLQNAYYLYTREGFLAGTIANTVATTRAANTKPWRVWEDGDTREVAVGFRRRITQDRKLADFTHNGIYRVVMNMAAPLTSADAGPTTYLSGSMLWAYDGRKPAEANLMMFPDMQTSNLVASNSTGSLTNSAQYSYRVYYVAYRKNGERIQSGAITRSVTLGPADDTVTLTIPTLAHTRFHDQFGATLGDNLTNVHIEVYRSAGNSDLLYYLVSGQDITVTAGANRFVFNDTTQATVSFADGLSDTDLVSRPLDYLSYGYIENVPPPGPAIVASVGDRVFLAGGGVGKNSVWFSKAKAANEAAEFNEILQVTDAPDLGGEVTAISTLNETPVIFKRNGIFGLVGGGPNNTNTEGAFVARGVASDVGCLSAGAVATIPSGLVFHSGKGIYRLGQGFQVDNLGAPVQDYDDQTYGSITVVPDTTQVVFLGDEQTLIYDYSVDQWGTFTNHAGVNAVVWKSDTYAYMRTNGEVYLRDTSVYSDNGTAYRARYRTAPLRLEELLQGFWKVKRVLFLGKYLSAHTLRVKFWYNREGAPYETFVWDPADVLDLSSWGSGATWGSDDYWGGARDALTYQFERRPQRSKCATFSIDIEEIPGDTPGEGFEISELALRVRQRANQQKLGTNRKF